ncbi:Gfo/Idh/MocA family protein [Paenibacillus arenilitoris]|uniref:Gfo/Idh/MocA family oxidoreductase n=1 Tax=Paenibacillus arenilitoris TaxID=2772299 RepID=A0A927H8L7_9BACL|nr:Gfo/Idh/MocA family oxidoreductase [Paenibacillus arenilitoris]MBD2871697.1 Gfo/Idh/MocA family oxidoreductase [Paenibacillus arenilitoris]
MLNIGLIGLGFMGKTHLENYLRLEREGAPIRVVALCDVDEAKLNGGGGGGNIDTSSGNEIDYGRFRKYTSVQAMLEGERLDAVDITLPTFLHRDVAVQCLNSGVHVLCEKPMAMNAEECDAMIAAAEASGKQLMIGQCLRFWPAYVYLRELVAGGKFGSVTSAHFYRGGGTPSWGPWVLQNEKGGGALLDMHVHDTDVVNWLFGKPEAVSCYGRNVIPGSGYDIVSTHYRFADDKIVSSHVDWTLNGDFGFEMGYKVNFEHGNIQFEDGVVSVHPNEGQGFTAELPADHGYYYQLKYFAEALVQGLPLDTATPASTKESIEIVTAERESADRRGEWVAVP